MFRLGCLDSYGVTLPLRDSLSGELEAVGTIDVPGVLGHLLPGHLLPGHLLPGHLLPRVRGALADVTPL